VGPTRGQAHSQSHILALGLGIAGIYAGIRNDWIDDFLVVLMARMEAPLRRRMRARAAGMMVRWWSGGVTESEVDHLLSPAAAPYSDPTLTTPHSHRPRRRCRRRAPA
jgi:hypothetical protein